MEIARRELPPHSGPTGTLRVTLTETLPDGYVGARLWVTVLPAGTTLNEIGRGEAWLAGGTGIWFDDDPNNPEIRDRIRREGIEIPVFPYEAGEGFSAPVYNYLDPDLIPAPAHLPHGEYTVYVYREAEPIGADYSDFDCASFDATIDGDTAVTAPPLEPCG
jgi:hypothetical protein